MQTSSRDNDGHSGVTDPDEQSASQVDHRRVFDSDQVVHEVVTLLQTHSHQVGQYFAADISLPSPSHSSQLYTDIDQLVQIANGVLKRGDTSEQTLHMLSESVQRLVDLLFLSPAGLHAASIPSTFWTDTVIGQFLIRVLSWLERDDLISTLVSWSLPQEQSSPYALGAETRLHRRGHTLPPAFAKGLMGALIALFGYDGGTPDLLWLSVADLLPALHRWQDWMSLTATMNPLCAYYRSDLGIPRPVDYSFLERLREAISTRYPHGHAYLARQIGWHWWLTDYPLTRRWYSSYSVQHITGNDIVETLQQMTLPPPTTYPIGDARFAWAEEQRVRAACRGFVYALQYQGGIMCTITERDRVLVIRFTNCPFCANTQPDCSILFGLVERMLLWLYGNQTMSSLVRGQHIAWEELTEGLLDVRLVREDSHAVAVIFTTR